ncbi:expressed unknown protein [Seminavis robusta]|uniref:Uncharacterized protein n=1 Tax=Seminavis robusta TaxID=568900 RepID=A0A9N8DA92_9STRA|nr:expressed unknown protein [Seminavis robusta]|eukprot:Sro57_g033320.1 n/a (428) ;mRNA; f:70976-72350
MKLSALTLCISWLLFQAPSIMAKRSVKKPFARDCTIVEDKDEVAFTCKSTNAPEDYSSDSADSEDAASTRGIVLEPAIEIKDKIKYKVETGKKGVQVKIQYEQEYEQEYQEEDGSTEEISGESETEFEIVFDSIIEYAKGETKVANNTTDEQAYDWEADTVVQTLPLDDWNDLSTVMSAGVVSYFLASTSDQIVAFNFTISRTGEGEKLGANAMKIDVHIVNFPWQRNDTYLALVSSVSSELEVDVKHDDEATVLLAQQDVQIPFAGIDTIGFVPFGSYSWETMAEVVETDAVIMVDEESTSSTVQKSGIIGSAVGKPYQTIQVVATSPVDASSNETTSSSFEMAETIAYSFVGSLAQNASYIYWDPSAGVGYSESDDAEYQIIGENGDPFEYTQMSSAAATIGTHHGQFLGLLSILSLTFFVMHGW